MKQKILIIMLLAAVAGVGCSKKHTPIPSDPSFPDGYTPSTSPITFQVEDNWGDTKGNLLDEFDTGDTFSVLAYYLKGGVWDENTATPNFMHNQKVEFDGTLWSYTPLKYWSNNSEDEFHFYAYAPYSADIKPNGVSEAGYPSLTYAPIADEITSTVNAPEMIDFMTSFPVTASKDSPTVHFNFEHQLAQIRFSVKHTGDPVTTAGQTGDKVKITGITIDKIYPHQGDFNSDGKFVWQPSTQKTSAPIECVTDVLNGGLIDEYIINKAENASFTQDDDGYFKLTSKSGAIMMSPQTFSNTDDEKFEVGIEFELIKSHNVSEKDGIALNAATTMIMDKLTIEKGYIYNFRFDLSVTGYTHFILNADITREIWKTGHDHDFGTVE